MPFPRTGCALRAGGKYRAGSGPRASLVNGRRSRLQAASCLQQHRLDLFDAGRILDERVICR
jgi:hypothetical protein